MRVFVTVGSTFFDELIDAVLSRPVLEALREKGFSHLVVQCGRYPPATKLPCSMGDGPWKYTEEGVEIEMWGYKPTLKEEYRMANMIISHAGSGTILDALRMSKPMVVIPNSSLLDNHQADLATELDKLGYLKASSTKTLADDIKNFDIKSIVPFPPMVPSRFRAILDEEMGFV